MSGTVFYLGTVNNELLKNWCHEKRMTSVCNFLRFYFNVKSKNQFNILNFFKISLNLSDVLCHKTFSLNTVNETRQEHSSIKEKLHVIGIQIMVIFIWTYKLEDIINTYLGDESYNQEKGDILLFWRTHVLLIQSPILTHSKKCRHCHCFMSYEVGRNELFVHCHWYFLRLRLLYFALNGVPRSVSPFYVFLYRRTLS